MKNIIICGTGEFSREMYYYIKQSENNQNILFKGFLDYSSDSLKKYNLEKLYLGNEDSYNFSDSDCVLIAISDSSIREKIYSKLKNKGIEFFNYIHETTIIDEKLVDVGEGNIFAPYCVITNNIKFGKCNIFNTMNSIGHDVQIGSFNTFNSHCDTTGNVNIGDNNYFGSRVSILPNAKIGNNNKISAGSVVYKKIKNNSIYHGNPAIKVGNNE